MDLTTPDFDAGVAAPAGRRFAEVNGIRLSFETRGSGPALLLIMGYRLSAIAWPDEFVDRLARHFTVVTFDNRGTGESDKPVRGYAMANLARDACGLLDYLGIARAHVLGYSMGGAVAQEFVRQFPERIDRLVLCATMCGGPRATYCDASVQRVMHNLAGLTPDEAARKIWTVTYAPGYLAQHSDAAEVQMRRETANPTPLHAADLQFQAFARFDSSSDLPAFRCPTLVLTGDRDVLIPPQNADALASLIPHARKVVFADRGHRIMWEASEESAACVVDFLSGSAPAGDDAASDHATPWALAKMLFDAPMQWATMFAPNPADMMRRVSHSTVRALDIPFGDGKPVIVVPGPFAPALMVSPLIEWLRAVGYRPGVAKHLEADVVERTDRTGRKAVIVTFGEEGALALTSTARDRVSDVIVLGFATSQDRNSRPRVRRLAYDLTGFGVFLELTRVLASIRIELLDTLVDDRVEHREE